MKILKINFLFLIILFISACSSVPKNTSNSCLIFEERYFWYKHAKKSEKKWGTPVYLQLAIIKMLVKQLSMNVKIISGETIRDEDGLALSSRNRYLDKTEREIAPQLNVVIKEIKESLEKKDTNYVAMEYEAGQVLSRKGWDVDYVVIRTQNGLLRPSENDKELVVLGAAKLGQTRLIDNVEVFI